MKPIQFQVDEMPQTGELDEEGNFKFYIYCSNCCDDDYRKPLAPCTVERCITQSSHQLTFTKIYLI
jgi:hypothetical protein